MREYFENQCKVFDELDVLNFILRRLRDPRNVYTLYVM